MKKIAFITGASSGIGRSTAIELAKIGFSIIGCGRRQERLSELKNEIDKISSCVTLNFEISDEEAVNRAIQSLPDEWRNIEVLVNNAGNAHGLATLQDGNTNDWNLMLDINVKGLLYVSKVLIHGMVARKKGHIINVSSIAGKQTYQNGVVYCASKAAVEKISEGMRLELTQHGIKVTNIAPGAVETEFSLVRFKGDIERARNVYEGYTPLSAYDIANAIVYAVSAPPNVTIADMTIFASAQSAATQIHKNK